MQAASIEATYYIWVTQGL